MEGGGGWRWQRAAAVMEAVGPAMVTEGCRARGMRGGW